MHASNHLSTTVHARLPRSTLRFNGGTSMGLLLNQHDAPSNLLEMVVQDLGGGSPCGPRFPIPLSQVPLGRSRKYPLVTCDTPKDDWFSAKESTMCGEIPQTAAVLQYFCRNFDTKRLGPLSLYPVKTENARTFQHIGKRLLRRCENQTIAAAPGGNEFNH